MLVRYQWSEDGEVELCEKSTVKLEQERICYHCDRMIPVGEDAVQLKSESDGEIYLLHESCARIGMIH